MRFFAGSNTLTKGVYFLKKGLSPDIQKPSFLPTPSQRTPSSLRAAEPERFLEFYSLVEFGKHSSGIFHDMMSPLTTILLTLEEIKDSTDPKNEESICRALAASNRIKEFVKAARKGLKPDDSRQTFSPAHEIRDAMRFLGHKARRARVDIKCDLDDEALAFGIPLRFFQIALNLMSNAVDAYDGVDHDERVVRVFLEQNQTRLLFTVSDNGCGIDKNALPRIFDPFFSTKRSKGLGLGLSTLKDHIDSFDGSIEVESLVGFGSTFTASFPLPESQRAARAALDESELMREGDTRLAGA